MLSFAQPWISLTLTKNLLLLVLELTMKALLAILNTLLTVPGDQPAPS